MGNTKGIFGGNLPHTEDCIAERIGDDIDMIGGNNFNFWDSIEPEETEKIISPAISAEKSLQIYLDDRWKQYSDGDRVNLLATAIAMWVARSEAIASHSPNTKDDYVLRASERAQIIDESEPIYRHIESARESNEEIDPILFQVVSPLLVYMREKYGWHPLQGIDDMEYVPPLLRLPYGLLEGKMVESGGDCYTGRLSQMLSVKPDTTQPINDFSSDVTPSPKYDIPDGAELSPVSATIISALMEVDKEFAQIMKAKSTERFMALVSNNHIPNWLMKLIKEYKDRNMGGVKEEHIDETSFSNLKNLIAQSIQKIVDDEDVSGIYRGHLMPYTSLGIGSPALEIIAVHQALVDNTPDGKKTKGTVPSHGFISSPVQWAASIQAMNSVKDKGVSWGSFWANQLGHIIEIRTRQGGAVPIIEAGAEDVSGGRMVINPEELEKALSNLEDNDSKLFLVDILSRVASDAVGEKQVRNGGMLFAGLQKAGAKPLDTDWEQLKTLVRAEEVGDVPFEKWKEVIIREKDGSISLPAYLVGLTHSDLVRKKLSTVNAPKDLEGDTFSFDTKYVPIAIEFAGIAKIKGG